MGGTRRDGGDVSVLSGCRTVLVTVSLPMGSVNCVRVAVLEDPAPRADQDAVPVQVFPVGGLVSGSSGCFAGTFGCVMLCVLRCDSRPLAFAVFSF